MHTCEYALPPARVQDPIQEKYAKSVDIVYQTWFALEAVKVHRRSIGRRAATVASDVA